MALMTNIELKIRLEDRVGALKRLRRLGARRIGVLRQTDTYIRVPVGRLKIREERSIGAELIFYERPGTRSPRTCRYDIARVPAKTGAGLKRMLVRGYGELVVVRKVRTLYLAGQTRIHLDRVEGLGDFLELETIVGKRTAVAARDEHRRVIAGLGLASGEPIGGSYSDLLLEKRRR
jgi:adenylate cyclase